MAGWLSAAAAAVAWLNALPNSCIAAIAGEWKRRGKEKTAPSGVIPEKLMVTTSFPFAQVSRRVYCWLFA